MAFHSNFLFEKFQSPEERSPANQLLGPVPNVHAFTPLKLPIQSKVGVQINGTKITTVCDASPDTSMAKTATSSAALPQAIAPNRF